jgi:hypothetical protein
MFKVNFTLEQAVKAQTGSRGIALLFPNATPRPLCPRKGTVGPRAGLDGGGKPLPHRDSIPGPSSPFPVAIPTELSRPTHNILFYCNRIVLQLPTVFSTVTCCTGL